MISVYVNDHLELIFIEIFIAILLPIIIIVSISY